MSTIPDDRDPDNCFRMAGDQQQHYGHLSPYERLEAIAAVVRPSKDQVLLTAVVELKRERDALLKIVEGVRDLLRETRNG